jgi:hypothetical protein
LAEHVGLSREDLASNIHARRRGRIGVENQVIRAAAVGHAATHFEGRRRGIGTP